MRLFIALFYLLLPIQGITLTTDCQQSIENGVEIYLGYSASDNFSAVSQMEFMGSAVLVGSLPDTYTAGEHKRLFSVQLFDGAQAYWTIQGADTADALIIRADMDLPDCQSAPEHPPSTIEIPIELTTDCAFIETKDYLDGVFTGHWSTVTSDDNPVLLHYGQALIGSATHNANPADYRAIPTPCF